MRMTPEEDGESVVRRASAGRSFNGVCSGLAKYTFSFYMT